MIILGVKFGCVFSVITHAQGFYSSELWFKNVNSYYTLVGSYQGKLSAHYWHFTQPYQSQSDPSPPEKVHTKFK